MRSLPVPPFAGMQKTTVEREGKVYKYSEIVNEVSDDGDD